MPGTFLSMQNIYLVKKNYANPPEGDTKPPEGDNSMKFVYHQLNRQGHVCSLYRCHDLALLLPACALHNQTRNAFRLSYTQRHIWSTNICLRHNIAYDAFYHFKWLKYDFNDAMQFLHWLKMVKIYIWSVVWCVWIRFLLIPL